MQSNPQQLAPNCESRGTVYLSTCLSPWSKFLNWERLNVSKYDQDKSLGDDQDITDIPIEANAQTTIDDASLQSQVLARVVEASSEVSQSLLQPMHGVALEHTAAVCLRDSAKAALAARRARLNKYPGTISGFSPHGAPGKSAWIRKRKRRVGRKKCHDILVSWQRWWRVQRIHIVQEANSWILRFWPHRRRRGDFSWIVQVRRAQRLPGRNYRVGQQI